MKTLFALCFVLGPASGTRATQSKLNPGNPVDPKRSKRETVKV